MSTLKAVADSTALNAALLLFLAIILGFALRGPWFRFSVECAALWAALRPDFGPFAYERWMTQTFHMLISAMLAFSVLIIVWSAGAGILRAFWLAGSGFPASGVSPDTLLFLKTDGLLCKDGCGWRDYGFLAVQIGRAVGGVLLVGTAAGLLGSLLGFLFGIPLAASERPNPPAEPTASNAARSGVNRPPDWKLNTNLTKVSDWLTGIIVGVGLVEAKTGISGFIDLSNEVANWLFTMRHGSPVIIGATIVGSVVFGFLFSYLFAQFIVTQLTDAAGKQLYLNPNAGATLHGIGSLEEAVVPRISRSARMPDPMPSPTQEQVAAALRYQGIPFDVLIASSAVSQTDIQNWARAKAVLNDYAEAAKAYLHPDWMRM